MAYDIEELRFGGMIVSVAENEMSESVNDDKDREFVTGPYQQYLEAGKPKNPCNWIRQELKKHFLYVTKPPAWIERTTTPPWPFFQGKPMVFIEQFTVPENDVSRTVAFPGTVVYVFVARKPVDDVPGGWMMEFRAVEQVPDL